MSEPGGRRNVTGLGRAYPDPETGKLYFSVTNFLGVIAKDALVPWAAKMERLACLAASSAAFEEVGVDINCTPAEFSKIVEANLGKQRAHVRELEKAGDIGTETHNRIEWTLRKQMGHIVAAEPPTISEPAMIAFRSWETWASEANFKPLYVEQVVISREHEYGGAIDYVAEGTLPETGPDPAMFILDWKTGKGLYPEARLQNAAYRHAYIEMGHGPVDKPLHGLLVKLPKKASDPGFQTLLLPEAEQEENFQAFLAVQRLWRWIHREQLKRLS